MIRAAFFNFLAVMAKVILYQSILSDDLWRARRCGGRCRPRVRRRPVEKRNAQRNYHVPMASQILARKLVQVRKQAQQHDHLRVLGERRCGGKAEACFRCCTEQNRAH